MKITWIRIHWRESLIMLLYALPTLSLIPLGFLWLLDHHASLPWAAALLVCSTAGFGLIRMRRVSKSHSAPPEPAEANWGEAERAAWARVQDFANQAPALSLDSYDQTTQTLHKTLDLVASSLHADRPNAIAHFTVPEALTAAESLCRAIKLQLVQHVPFIKTFHVSRGLWAREKYSKAAPYLAVAIGAYRAIRLITSQESGTLREGANQLLDTASNALTTTVKQQITRTVIHETGRAAINLYSGRFRLTDEDLNRVIAAERDRLAATAPPQPIRILIAGQVNAGKSSLINALAGAVRAPVHALPTATTVRRYEIKTDGQPAVDLIETPALTSSPANIETLVTEAGQADLILWVAAAAQPARDIDVAALATLRQRLNSNLNHPAPPILLAVTQIDRLRPTMEWLPPYNIAAPDRPKAVTIRDAVAASASTLSIPAEAAVPVAMPNGAEPYQIDALWACIGALLPAAQQRQLNRMITATRADWNLGEALRAVINSGTVLLPMVLNEVINKVPPEKNNGMVSVEQVVPLLRPIVADYTSPETADLLARIATTLLASQTAPQPQDQHAHR
jgi:predicted GTPase